jgi:HAD superfamily hydrolase (TIGR01509 family)
VSAPVELVIFDNDGVLVDSEPIAARTLAAELAASGIPITAAEVTERFSGSTMSAVLRELSCSQPVAVPDGFQTRYDASLLHAFGQDLRAAPDAQAVLDALDALGVQTCVASNASRHRLTRSLGFVGLLERFADAAFSADDVAAGKPAPDLFLLAARSYGTDPHACIVVEDTPTGVLAARRAGMRVIAVLGTSDVHALRDADVIVDRLGDVVEAIRGLAVGA